MMVLHQTSCVVFTIRRTDSLSAGVLAPKKTIHGLSIEWSLSRDGTTKRPLMTSLFVRGQTRSRWRNCQDCVPCVCSSAEEMKRWIKYEERDNPNVTKRYKEAGGGAVRNRLVLRGDAYIALITCLPFEETIHHLPIFLFHNAERPKFPFGRFRFHWLKSAHTPGSRWKAGGGVIH
jgi:hypothetical protein